MQIRQFLKGKKLTIVTIRVVVLLLVDVTKLLNG